MHVVDLDELLHSLVDNAAETTLNGHVDHCWLDVVFGHPFKALQSTATAALVISYTLCSTRAG
jgi:hypothetical protein